MDTENISAAASAFSSLLIILGLLAVAAFLARRFRGRVSGLRAGGMPSGNMPVSILSSRSLGGQHNLVVAHANGQHFLLGVSRNGITLISRLDANNAGNAPHHEPNHA